MTSEYTALITTQMIFYRTNITMRYVLRFRLLSFNSPIEFEHVAIGQVGPVPRKENTAFSEIASITSPEKPVGCMKEGSFSLEPGAVKFGDNPHSYVHIAFGKRHNMQKNFKMDFRFRSFYPNGLLFILMV